MARASASGGTSLRDWLAAVGGAAALYATLFLLFQWQAPGTGSRRGRLPPRLVMLPIDETPVSPGHRELQAWVQLLDPTLMSLPNQRYGFSQLRNYEFERPVEDLSPMETPLAMGERYEAEQLPLTEPVGDPLTALQQQRRTKAPAAPVLPPPVERNGQVYWSTMDGTVIDWLPELTPSTDGSSRVVDGPTYITVVARQPLYRVQLQSSCGDVELDGLAIRALRGYFHRGVEGLPTPATQWLDAHPAWNFEVHWRYHPDIRQAPPAATGTAHTELTRDHAWF